MIRKIEDLETWQETVGLLKLIYSILDKFPKYEEFNLKKHMRECARNIPSNIAEGFGRMYCRDSKRFYRIALGSLNELKSDTNICFQLGYISKDLHFKIIRQITRCLSLLHGLIRSAVKVKHKNF